MTPKMAESYLCFSKVKEDSLKALLSVMRKTLTLGFEYFCLMSSFRSCDFIVSLQRFFITIPVFNECSFAA